MKQKLFLLLLLFVGVNNIQAQSWKDFFSKKNISKVANVAGIDIPFEIEGNWSYIGTAVQLETDDIIKKTAAEVAAVAVEERVNQELQKYGLTQGMVQFSFSADGKLSITAAKYSLPATYTLSEDQKTMTISVAKMVNLDAVVQSTLDDSISLLFNADKLIEAVKFLSNKFDYASIKTISQVLENYDGLKIGVELEKVK